MKTNRCPPSPTPALVAADDDPSSSAPSTISSRRARKPGRGSYSCCPGHPVICIVLSLSRAAGALICREGEDQRQTGMGKRGSGRQKERDRKRKEENSKTEDKREWQETQVDSWGLGRGRNTVLGRQGDRDQANMGMREGDGRQKNK